MIPLNFNLCCLCVRLLVSAGTCLLLSSSLLAQVANFHNAPDSTKQSKNPYAGQSTSQGRQLFQANCSKCHGDNAGGMGNVPSLKTRKIKSVHPGELFWFITQGDVNNGMPSWASLSAAQRWRIVTYLQGLGARQEGQNITQNTSAPTAVSTVSTNAPPPTPPFTDFRYEEPGKIRKITLADLPPPFATPSAPNGPKVVPRPEAAWPKVPSGFKVDLFATGFQDRGSFGLPPTGISSSLRGVAR